MWPLVLIPYIVIYGIVFGVVINKKNSAHQHSLDTLKTSVISDFSDTIEELDDKFTFIISYEKIQRLLTAMSREKLLDAIDTKAEISSLFESLFFEYQSSDI